MAPAHGRPTYTAPPYTAPLSRSLPHTVDKASQTKPKSTLAATFCGYPSDVKKKRTLIATLSKVPANELANVIPNLNEDSLGFLAHCFGGILRCDCRHLKLTKKEKNSPKTLGLFQEDTEIVGEEKGHQTNSASNEITKRRGSNIISRSLICVTVDIFVN